MTKDEGLKRLRTFMVDRFFPDVVAARLQHAVKAVDDQWWRQVGAPGGPSDPQWNDRLQDLKDALDAWRHNPLARQIVRLTRGFVLQDGLQLRAATKREQRFVDDFWNHRQNRMNWRLRAWCDSLVLNGEIFPTLFTNDADGMTYVRSISARLIDQIETAENDFENERRYHQVTDTLDGQWWTADSEWQIATSSGVTQPELSAISHLPSANGEMLHFAVNRPEGGTRGSGDLDPILPWLERYKTWLTDRVAINKAKTRLAWDVTIQGADESYIAKRQAQIKAAMSATGGVNIHNERESAIQPVFPGIASDAVEPDGRALRLMIGAGVGISLHHFGESDSANRASAGSADRAMLMHYRTRQQELIEIAIEVTQRAAARAKARGRLDYPSRRGFTLEAEVGELTKEDNLMLAQAARQVVEALGVAHDRGWLNDELAARLMLKFAGEVVPMQSGRRTNDE